MFWDNIQTGVRSRLDLGGRDSEEARGLQLVDASVQDANPWESDFNQVCCKLWGKKGGGGKVTHDAFHIFTAYAFSFSSPWSQPVWQYVPIAARVPWKCQDPATLMNMASRVLWNPANGLCLSATKLKNLQQKSFISFNFQDIKHPSHDSEHYCGCRRVYYIFTC